MPTPIHGHNSAKVLAGCHREAGTTVRGEKVPDARGVWKELSRVKGELRRVKGGDVEDE